MVFRGRLSKACQRCRERRLRCDFQRPSCSSCIRASVPCVGYRDTVTIRIADETDDVRTKAGARSVATQAQQLSYLAPNIESTARDMFFVNYIGEYSQTWDVMIKYYNTVGVPEHLTLSLDAVSLKFLSHITSSFEADDLSRKKYISALRMINAELKHADSAKKPATFEGALLLDLFEKFTKSATEDTVPRHAHVEGALALATLRGIESFQEEYELKSLLGLSINATVCCLTARRKISEPIRTIRSYATRYLDTTNFNWRLSNVLMDIVDLVADIYADTITLEEKVATCARLDNCLEAISQEATPAWSYESILLPAEHAEGLLPRDAPSLYNRYPGRAVMHTWNILRLLRILLYEELNSHCQTPSYSLKLPQPPTFITPTIHQICASVPYITDCSFAAAHNLAPGSPCQHSPILSSPPSHTTKHRLGAYRLMFPLYVAAWSRYCPMQTRQWILDQLKYIATHFDVSGGDTIRDLLLKEMDTGDPVKSWYVVCCVEL
ncbi:C6 transcription factor [Stagonosporopsis vannaccii]|nr:C6 transcription factor [Stagonosporopsis vannaccii]